MFLVQNHSNRTLTNKIFSSTPLKVQLFLSQHMPMNFGSNGTSPIKMGRRLSSSVQEARLIGQMCKLPGKKKHNLLNKTRLIGCMCKLYFNANNKYLIKAVAPFMVSYASIQKKVMWHSSAKNIPKETSKLNVYLKRQNKTSLILTKT